MQNVVHIINVVGRSFGLTIDALLTKVDQVSACVQGGILRSPQASMLLLMAFLMLGLVISSIA